MCGIFGGVDFSDRYGSDLFSYNSHSVLHSLRSRGPDSSGIWSDNRCLLGHTRLSIIDLSDSAAQPMHSACNNFVVTFNGEIYNFLELRKTLSVHYSFTTDSDTEVLLAGWIHYRHDFFDLIDGMFACAIWDKCNQQIILARDKFGEKPLYYSFINNILTFSSRPSELFLLNKYLIKSLDYANCSLFLESGYFPSERSCFNNVSKVLPSSYIVFSKSNTLSNSYWDFAEIPTNYDLLKANKIDLLDELEILFISSLKRRLIADVPVGAFLSGGIDSSLVVALAAKFSNSQLKTFTIGFNEEAYDESAYASSVAEYLSLDHYDQIMSVNNLLDFIPTFQNNFDEPFFDSAAFPTLAVSKLASNHISVALTGDGGDELFGGYHYYKIINNLKLAFWLPHSFRIFLFRLLRFIPGHQIALLFNALMQKDMCSVFSFMRSISKDISLSAPDDLTRLNDLFLQRSNLFMDNISDFEKCLRLDTSFTLTDDYLQKTDLASMSFSLECRTPFLNSELAAWAFSLPTKLKLNFGTGKLLLRELAFRHIPKGLLDRPKRGFGVPIDSWLRNDLSNWALERIESKELYDGLPITYNDAIQVFKTHQSRKRNLHSYLWAIVQLLDFKSRMN